MEKVINQTVTPAQTSLNDHDFLLALASHFDGDFLIDWLGDITGKKASALLTVLENGVRQQLLTSKQPGIYSFKSHKVQKEWQDHLDLEEKEQFHRTIANLFITELPEPDNVFPVARHLLHITNDAKGCQWLLRAGHMHMDTFKIEEASRYFKKIIDDLLNQKGEEEDLLFIEAAIEYSNISTARDDIMKILSLLQEAMTRAKKNGVERYEALLDMHIAKNKWLLTRFDEALEHFDSGISKVKKLADPQLQAPTTSFKTYFLFWQGRFREVIQEYERSRPDVDNYPLGQFPTVAAITVARAYTMIGQFTQGLGMLDNIREHCLAIGNLYMAARAALTIASALVSIHRLDEAIQYLGCALEEATKSQNYYVILLAKFLLGYTYYLTGKEGRSIAYLREFLKHSSDTNVSLWIHPQLLEICWAMEERNLPQIKRLSLEEQVQLQLEAKSAFTKGMAYRYQAFLKQKTGRPAQDIADSLNISIKHLQKTGNPIELAKSQLELARLYLSKGEEEKGKKLTQLASEALESLNPALIPDELKSLVIHRSFGEPHLKEIMDLGEQVVRQNDDKQLLLDILTRANRIIGAERGAVFLFEKDSQTFQVRASKNLTIDQVNHADFTASMQTMKDVALSGKSRILGEVPKKNNGNSKNIDVIRSSIYTPIILKNNVLGVLYHDNRLLSNAFKKSDLDLLSFFATLIAYQLENTRANQVIEQLTERYSEDNLNLKPSVIRTTNPEGIIGKSEVIQNVLTQIEQAAPTDTTVLILGETGVGKELIARAIRKQSLREKGPYVRLQCSAIPESLITTELFGHEKGAFTGATYRRIGRFELADKGTLFLDEIGDLPLETQVRLLRVLQTKEFERIGGEGKILSSDFRLIVATNQDLESLVGLGTFRADLYYRINIFPIHIPPLRERKEDIPLLAEHFLNIYGPKSGKTFKGIPDKEIQRMMYYDWPGNIRELEHTIERSTIICSGPNLHVPDLQTAKINNDQIGTFPSLAQNERQYILKALQQTSWKLRGPSGAAELLDIHPSTLASRMKKLSIRRPKRVRTKSPVLYNEE